MLALPVDAALDITKNVLERLPHELTRFVNRSRVQIVPQRGGTAEQFCAFYKAYFWKELEREAREAKVCAAAACGILF